MKKREIKFRFFDIRNKRYIPISELEGKNLLKMFSDPNIISEEYTGRKDKYMKEIYHNDIFIDYEKNKFVVEYRNGEWYLNLIEGRVNSCKYLCRLCTAENGEVIGNIFENPELITK